ncbi:response regulator transcription factor [Novosphingobium rosa]|uniref:response regulator transcription factor n=1 Tax=Novosphingobium rosa TaxID=76978 RepID=UPI00082F2959|nr:response regulator [Novosphingobium rosa]
MTVQPPSCVAVLDDDADFAAAVARLLVRQGLEASFFTKPAALLGGMMATRFSCVVSDIQMAETDGFTLAEHLRARDPCVALVFMTAWPTTAHAVDAVRRHGGLDYLEKPLDESRLIVAVHEGLAWSARKWQVEQATGAFTRREREVFDVLVKGHSNKEVADLLGISVRTVEDHRAAIVSKTRANGLAQLVALSRGEG